MLHGIIGWGFYHDSHLALNIRKEETMAVTDALSHVTSKLNAEAVKPILDSVTVGTG